MEIQRSVRTWVRMIRRGIAIIEMGPFNVPRCRIVSKHRKARVLRSIARGN